MYALQKGIKFVKRPLNLRKIYKKKRTSAITRDVGDTKAAEKEEEVLKRRQKDLHQYNSATFQQISLELLSEKL